MTSELVDNNDWETFPGLFGVGSDDGPVPDRKEAVLLLFQLGTIRHFEQWLVDHEDLVHGPVHSSIGQEAVAVGAVAGLKDADAITSTHRAHYHVLAKVMAYTTDEQFDPVENSDPPSELSQAVYRTMAEILGLRDGWAGRRGGSMHRYCARTRSS